MIFYAVIFLILILDACNKHPKYSIEQYARRKYECEHQGNGFLENVQYLVLIHKHMHMDTDIDMDIDMAMCRQKN